MDDARCNAILYFLIYFALWVMYTIHYKIETSPFDNAKGRLLLFFTYWTPIQKYLIKHIYHTKTTCIHIIHQYIFYGQSTLHNQHLSMLVHTIFFCTQHFLPIPLSFTRVMFIDKYFNIKCVHMSLLSISKCFVYIIYIKH